MLDIPVMGVNAPKEHQRVIRQLTTGLAVLFTEGRIPYEPFPEVMVDESQTSPTPDVLLFDNQSHQNVVIVEVSGKAAAKKDFSKVMEICDQYEIAEGFVYDYISKKWRKYKYGVGEIINVPSFCESIGYDLNTFLS